MRLRSRWRLAQIFITAAWDSGPISLRLGERRAATATERASLGSFLLTAPVFNSRTRAASFGWTSTTRSPAVTSCSARRRPRHFAPSIAQVRSGHPLAHSSNRSTWVTEELTRISPSFASTPSRATAVWEPLWGSMPIITADMRASFAFGQVRTAAGMSDFGSTGALASFEPHHGEIRRAGTSI